MNATKLIAALKRFPGDTVVVFDDAEHGLVEIVKVSRRKPTHGIPGILGSTHFVLLEGTQSVE